MLPCVLVLPCSKIRRNSNDLNGIRLRLEEGLCGGVSQMRIAELHWAFPPTIGGVETHLSILGPALVQRGHQVALLTGQPGGLPPRSVVKGMPVYRTSLLDLNRMSPKLFEEKAPDIFNEIGEFLSHVNPDVIHVHNWHYFSPIPLEAVLAWNKHHGRGLVLTAHNSWHDALFQQMAQYAPAYDAVIAVSQHTLDDMVEWGYPRDQMRVVHHGVTRDWLQAPHHPQPVFPAMKDRPVIFHPARMSLAKGSLVVVEAFRLVRQYVPDAYLLLAGTSLTVDWDSVQNREIQQIQDKIREYHLEEHVGIYTFQWPEIRAAYDAADVVVYPSVFPEPFGIVVIEAMAREKPVVVTRAGGMPEIVTHRQSGWIVDPNNPEALADALRTLLTNRPLAAQLAMGARQRVWDWFTAERMVKQTESILLAATGVEISHDQPVAP